MYRILILSSDPQKAKALKSSIKDLQNVYKTETAVALTFEDAISLIGESINSRQPFTFFLVDRTLQQYKDGIDAIKELLVLSQDTDAVIINGFDNSEDRIRAYESGAKQYLLQMCEPREVLIVLNELAQMRRKKQELEYKSILAARTSWAAELAHEINQEVYKIQSAAYLIKLATKKGSEIHSHAEIILGGAQNLANVGKYGGQAATLIEVDKDIKTYATEICKKKVIPLKLSLRSSESKVMTNIIGFHYIFKQLIDNAVLAMDEREQKAIYIRTRLLDNEMVEIRVRDTGPGVSDAVRFSIFHSPVTTKIRGGYGLLFVRQLIENMGGDISLAPFNKKHGAEFIIKIPCISGGNEITSG